MNKCSNVVSRNGCTPPRVNPLSPIDVYRHHLDPMHFQNSSVQKETKKASEGLGTTLRDELKNLVRFHMSWAFLILMRFIDPRIFESNDIHRPHPGPQENLQNWWCKVCHQSDLAQV